MVWKKREVLTAALLAATTTATNAEDECRLYLAPSILSSNFEVKFGLYSGVDIAENETLPFVPELAIPLVDFIDGPFHDPHKGVFDYIQARVWDASYAGGSAAKAGNYTSRIFIPGLGSLAQHHAGFSNIAFDTASPLSVVGWDKQAFEGQLLYESGVPHPSRGAITPYENITLRATKNIPAGMELFNDWDFEDEDDGDGSSVDDVFEQRIRKQDYVDADNVMDRLLRFFDENPVQKESVQEDIIDFVLDKVLFQTGAGKRVKGIRSLIPRTLRKMRQAKELGGAFMFRNQDMIRSKHWLHRKGVCVDTIRPGSSTSTLLPDAGRGAFAARKLEKDDIISVSPIMLILEQDTLIQYEINATRFTDDNGQDMTSYENVLTKPIGRQLIYNYAYGHPESSLLLVPQAPAIHFINHAPTAAAEEEEEESSDVGPTANAEFQWSEQDGMSDNSLHTWSVQDMKDNWGVPNMIIQIVATREIAEGEEILMDYGSDWQEAWTKYKAGYDGAVAAGNGRWLLRATDILKMYKNKPWPVNPGYQDKPYPDGMTTECFIAEYEDLPDGVNSTDENGLTKITWTGPTKPEDFSGGDLVPCHVLNRTKLNDDDGFYNYTVQATMFQGSWHVLNVPHSAITLSAGPYGEDFAGQGAFRHWIGIPDDKFPQKWRNLR